MCNNQNSILSFQHIGEPTTMGYSAWEALFTRVHGALADTVASGLGTNNTREQCLDLISSLKSTFAVVELLIDVKDATDLKQGRKQESLMRRLTQSLATYFWCQTFSVWGGFKMIKLTPNSVMQRNGVPVFFDFASSTNLPSLYICKPENVLGRVPLMPFHIGGNAHLTLPHRFGNRAGATADSSVGRGNRSRFYQNLDVALWAGAA
jgi:hypothetical protein